ncbi:MAG: S8 family serine peptidase, partial [Legionella sp.]|nr:S8 family serine peptidase [Legionella sp.]
MDPADKPRGANFTHVAHLFDTHHLLYFKLHNHSGCYSEKIISKLMSEIKKAEPEIEAITPNFLSSIEEIEALSESDILKKWNLLSPPGGIDAENASLSITPNQVNSTVAVLDGGVLSHDALNPNILPGVHFTDANQAGIDASPSCMDCAGFDHGTRVAGIVSSIANSTDSKILPINVFTKFTDTETCGFPPCLYSYFSDQLNAMRWLAGEYFSDLPAAPKNIVAMNMSLGATSRCPDIAQKIIAKVHQKGLSIIAAAGNQNRAAVRTYPANCPGVISVAATGYYGERASYSNWGEAVSIAAPGGSGRHSIYSLTENGYSNKQGTSFSAPHVSGVIALLYLINPALTRDEAEQIILSKDAV